MFLRLKYAIFELFWSISNLWYIMRFFYHLLFKIRYIDVLTKGVGGHSERLFTLKMHLYWYRYSTWDMYEFFDLLIYHRRIVAWVIKHICILVLATQKCDNFRLYVELKCEVGHDWVKTDLKQVSNSVFRRCERSFLLVLKISNIKV